MKTQKQQQFEDWDYHVRNKPIKQEMNKPMTPQNKLYEAAKNVWKVADKINAKANGLSVLVPDEDFCALMRSIHELSTASSAYEQEQPEAIAGDKTIIEIWKEWCEKDISWTDAALGAMRDFASQQTSAKDKEIADLSGELHATDKLNQELQDEIAELKQRISAIKEKLPDNKIRELNPIWVRDEIISELEKQK